MAEILLKNETEKLQEDRISVSSAGLHAYPGTPPDREMIEYLSELGITSEKHQAKKITRKDVDWADRILVMEKEHQALLKKLWPGAGDKVELLGRFISEDQKADDIIDPFGKSPYHYRLARAQITLAVKNLVKSIALNQSPETKR